MAVIAGADAGVNDGNSIYNRISYTIYMNKNLYIYVALSIMAFLYITRDNNIYSSLKRIVSILCLIALGIITASQCFVHKDLLSGIVVIQMIFFIKNNSGIKRIESILIKMMFSVVLFFAYVPTTVISNFGLIAYNNTVYNERGSLTPMSADSDNPLNRLYVNRTQQADYCASPVENPDEPYFKGQDYGQFVDDGLALIKGRSGDTSLSPHVISLTFSNPFPLTLGLPPARGDFLWLDPYRTISEKHPPKIDDFLGQADIVMVPRKGHHNVWISQFLISNWHGAFEARFKQVAQSNCWALFVPSNK